MKLIQNQNSFTIYNGWYGLCDQECSEFDLKGYDDILYAVYQFNSNGVGTYSFLSNINNDDMQSFTSLSCGKSYFIVLKQGTEFIEIPNFVYSSYNEVGENYLSKECKTDDESFAPTEDDEIKEETDLSMPMSWNQGTYTYSVDVKMPSSYNSKYPVAILLHGAGGNGEQMTNSFANDLPNHILLGITGYQNSWNISNETSNGPDIDMLMNLINRVKQFSNVDETKIRIVGVSNGGALALRAAVEINDSALDVIACCISQTNTDQYRNDDFYFPSNHEQTGNIYANDGYDTIQNSVPQRKILQLNGANDNVVPYNGGNFAGLTFLSASDSALAYAKSQGYTGSKINPTSYGENSLISNYGDVIFLSDSVGHTVSSDMKYLLNQFLENNYSVSGPYVADPVAPTTKKILALHGGGGSSYGLQSQKGVSDLVSSLSDVEFVFADAPGNLWMQDPPGGKDYPTTDPNWADNSIAYLDGLVEQHGPFFGILGYSQGAAFIPVYLANTSNTFDIALMYNGYLPYTHLGLMNTINESAPFDIPAVIFSGEYDYAFKDMAPDLYDKFSNAIYVRSLQAGHNLPYNTDSTYNQILDYINSVEPTNNYSNDSSSYTADSAFLNYTGSESDRSSREVVGGDDGNTSLYCRVSGSIENVDGTDKLVVRSNGVPNYTPKVGSTIIQGSWSDELSVSNDGNPNTIGEQDYTFTIPLIDVTVNPVNSESDDLNNVTETALSAIGVSSNGVPIFNPWHNNQGDFLASSRDAITFATFSSCCGHPSGAGPGRTGAGPYHYHKYPTCIAGNRGLSPSSDIIEEQDMADVLDEKLTKTGSEGHSPILGYMIDGYPVYGPIGTTDTTFTSNTELKILKSSFVLNGSVYQYVRGNGDLDKCNAIYSATPEYPNGCYHYVLSIDSNSDGTVKRTENPLYIYRDGDTNEQKMIITPMYPHTTVYYRGSEFGSFTNGDRTTSINPNDDPCAGFGVTWGPTIGPPPVGCNQQPPPQ